MSVGERRVEIGEIYRSHGDNRVAGEGEGALAPEETLVRVVIGACPSRGKERLGSPLPTAGARWTRSTLGSVEAAGEQSRSCSPSLGAAARVEDDRDRHAQRA